MSDTEDQQLLRYSRQILLPEIGVEGQQRLANRHALIIGLGGLGSPAAMYLAAAGVGTLTLCDFDQADPACSCCAGPQMFQYFAEHLLANSSYLS